MKLMKKIKVLMGEKARIRLGLLFVLPLFGSILETLGVSTIVAFITMIMDESVFQSNELLKRVYAFTRVENYKSFVILMASLLILFYVFKTVYLTLQYYVQNKIVKQTQQNLAAKLFHIIIHKPYEYFVNVNVAELTRIISEDVTRTGDYILNFVQMLSEFLTAFMLVMMLLVIDTKMTIFICAFLLCCMVAIRLGVKKKLKEAGKVQQYNFKERQKWLNQSVYGIKDIKICRNETFFENKFCKANKSWNETEIVYSFWNRTPSFLIELVIMLTILFYLIIVVASGSNINEMITTLSAFAFSAVRLLPACNRISSYMTTMSYRQHSFNLIHDMILENEEKIPIPQDGKNIRIGEMKQGLFGKNISFCYQNAEKKVFEKANISIPKGMSIGIVGASGSGKTTIVDILLGLLKPQVGVVELDEINIEENYSDYLDKVSYIPQNIFLIDDSIRNNVAYGIEEEKISEEKVWKALEEAQIKEYVESLPEGLETVVGDRGVRISGGQRQRIGIARALYNNPEILVFDEATSALDNETEAAIMESINYFKGKKTMIIIAHRLSTIEKCDIVYKVEDGCVEKLEDGKSNEL